MLKITEIPHRGRAVVWYANDMNDLCVKALAARARADIDPAASDEAIVEWLRSDLQSLTIEPMRRFAAGIDGQNFGIYHATSAHEAYLTLLADAGTDPDCDSAPRFEDCVFAEQY